MAGKNGRVEDMLLQPRTGASRTVVLVRHARSTHNTAEENWDISTMLLQRDHPLSSEGLGQARALGERIRRSRDKAFVEMVTAPTTALYSSPLTRALQTCLIGLMALPAMHSGVRLLPDARELGAGPLYGRDCLGVAVGRDAILRRASAEAVAAGASKADMAVLGRARVDASLCEGRWWSLWEPSYRWQRARIRATLEFLLDDGLDSGKDCAVLCCHAIFIRELVRAFAADELRSAAPDLVGPLEKRWIDNTGCLAIRVRKSPCGRRTPRISVVAMRFVWDSGIAR